MQGEETGEEAAVQGPGCGIGAGTGGGQTAPARGHLQSMGSFLGTLRQSRQTHCVDSFSSGVGVPTCSSQVLTHPPAKWR